MTQMTHKLRQDNAEITQILRTNYANYAQNAQILCTNYAQIRIKYAQITQITQKLRRNYANYA